LSSVAWRDTMEAFVGAVVAWAVAGKADAVGIARKVIEVRVRRISRRSETRAAPAARGLARVPAATGTEAGK